MSELVSFARRELALLRGPNAEPDEMQDAMEAHIISMVELFSEEGHSGSSASYALSILKKLLAFEPLTPLTGADDEWLIHDFDDHMYAQNKRCSHVFKRRDGTAYDINAVVFQDPDGTCCTNSESRRDVAFPYTPTQEIVLRPQG